MGKHKFSLKNISFRDEMLDILWCDETRQFSNLKMGVTKMLLFGLIRILNQFFCQKSQYLTLIKRGENGQVATSRKILENWLLRLTLCRHVFGRYSNHISIL